MLEQVESAAACGLRSVPACDLCGAPDFATVAQASPDCCRTVMCTHCGLFFAAPSLAIEALEAFYDEEFDGDPGAGARLLGGAIELRRVGKEERAARGWALPIIRRHLDPAGKRILDVRGRTGGLAQALHDAGADVVVVDPMPPNVEHVRSRRGIAAQYVPVKDFATLPGWRDDEFDAVTALTIHILGHLPSPKAFLERITPCSSPTASCSSTRRTCSGPRAASADRCSIRAGRTSSTLPRRPCGPTWSRSVSRSSSAPAMPSGAPRSGMCGSSRAGAGSRPRAGRRRRLMPGACWRTSRAPSAGSALAGWSTSP